MFTGVSVHKIDERQFTGICSQTIYFNPFSFQMLPFMELVGIPWKRKCANCTAIDVYY